MCDEIGLVRGQHSSQESQILEVPEFGIWCVDILTNRYGKCGLVAEQSEEDQVFVPDVVANLPALQKYSTGRVTADKASITPNWHETRFLTRERFGQPVGILAALAIAIDECTGEDIVDFHEREFLFSYANFVCVECNGSSANLACWAGFAVECIGILHVAGIAGSAHGKV